MLLYNHFITWYISPLKTIIEKMIYVIILWYIVYIIVMKVLILSTLGSRKIDQATHPFSGQ